MAGTIQAKTILNRSKRRDPWYLDDYTINPYSGCSFNCLYCYIRGSKYGIHMERKLSVKENAVELLDRQLYNRAKKGQYGIIVLSSATDPYLLIERETKLTRRLLEVILKYRFPLHIITKSDLVVRDLDLLEQIGEMAILPIDLQGQLASSCAITFSFSFLDEGLRAMFEPGATSIEARLDAFRQVQDAGFFSGLSLMPLLPGISDGEKDLRSYYQVFSEMGADYVMPASLTLFGSGVADSKTLVFEKVRRHYPHLVEKYQKLFSVPAYQRNYAEKVRVRALEIAATYDMPDRLCPKKET